MQVLHVDVKTVEVKNKISIFCSMVWKIHIFPVSNENAKAVIRKTGILDICALIQKEIKTEMISSLFPILSCLQASTTFLRNLSLALFLTCSPCFLISMYFWWFLNYNSGPGSLLQYLFAESCVFVPIAIIFHHFHPFVHVIWGVLFRLALPILIGLFSNIDSACLLAVVGTSAFVASLKSFQLFSALTSPVPFPCLLFSSWPFVLSFHHALPTSESSNFLYFLKDQFSSISHSPMFHSLLLKLWSEPQQYYHSQGSC